MNYAGIIKGPGNPIPYMRMDIAQHSYLFCGLIASLHHDNIVKSYSPTPLEKIENSDDRKRMYMSTLIRTNDI